MYFEIILKGYSLTVSKPFEEFLTSTKTRTLIVILPYKTKMYVREISHNVNYPLHNVMNHIQYY